MLAGKSALITGSTSEIGLAIARALAGAGCNITLNSFGDGAVSSTSLRRMGWWLAVQPTNSSCSPSRWR
jgi:3-hydroxybutyrate dehydrogenase